MYESFYGLKEKPFNLLPDPDYLYMSQGHENAYTHLEYAIAENKGFAIITGEIGSGKTTLINFLLSKIQQNIRVGLINSTSVSPTQLMKMICQEYELEVDGRDKAEMLDLFHGFLLSQFSERNRVALIIDEAQNLTPRTMEEIRMLSNLDAEKNHLIQIVLAGQPDLRIRLQRKELEQFAQRVTVHCHLDPLDGEEVGEFIRHRLRVAGTENLDIFDKRAIEAIYTYSRGIPRLINILCDNALVYGYADELRVVDKKTIDNVINAREAGGLFSYTHQDGEKGLSTPPMETSMSEPLKERLQLMQRRIHLIENMVGNLDQRLNALAKKREERDTVVLELFKMLKYSMESRFNTLLKFHRLRYSEKASKKSP
jgi:general secretion pathway protein A